MSRSAVESTGLSYRCDVTGCVYASHLLYRLKRHRYVQHFGKIQECHVPDCSYKTRNYGDMQKHILGHEGIKVFQCPQCSKKYARIHSVRECGWKHMNLKPLACKDCDYSTNMYTKLYLHKKVYHKSRDHRCDICGLDFTIQYKLTQHLKTANHQSLAILANEIKLEANDDAANEVDLKHSSFPPTNIEEIPQEPEYISKYFQQLQRTREKGLLKEMAASIPSKYAKQKRRILRGKVPKKRVYKCIICNDMKTEKVWEFLYHLCEHV